nr:transposase [Mitsuokella multacida]
MTSKARRNVHIIDDSLFSRNRSKKVELLARVYDHVSGTYVRGFRMLALGWSDGNTFLPLGHCLLSSASKQQQLQGASSGIDPRSNGGKQRKLAQSKAPEVVLTLLREAHEAGVPAQHVLFDLWFCSPALLHQIHEIGYDVIARVKKSEKMHFLCQGRMQDVKSIYRAHAKRRGRSAYLLSVQVEAVKDGKRLPVRLVFVRNKAKRGDYLVLVSTDLSLSEEEIIQTYGKRWNIEVFFKMCKSYLKLGKETRAISYDALTAHTPIVFTRYMMLALEQRRNVDERSIGELFLLTIDELEDLRYLDALAMLLKLLMDCARDAEILDKEQLNQLLDLFLARLPHLWQRCLKQCT